MGVLLMLMTFGVLFLAVPLLILAARFNLPWLGKFVARAAAVWLLFYAALLLGASMLSEEKTLGRNQPKKFCGFYLDCHLHASVSDVRRTPVIGDRIAEGEFYIVNLKVFSNAKRAELGLNNPKLYVVDADGMTYSPIGELEDLEFSLEQPVPAGGAFEEELIFDLPVDVSNPRLDISEGVAPERLLELVLIGDEDSFGHKRNYFSLAAPAAVAKN